MEEARVVVAEIEAPPRATSLVARREDRRVYHLTKRVMDVVISAVSLVLVSPLFLLVALAIKLDGRGPVLFRQERLGGRRSRGRGTSWILAPFTIYKFRTMVPDADTSIHREYMAAYLTADEHHLSSLRPDRCEGESYRPAGDPRVTRVGAILRKLSIDELPQLWNVLKGDMSIVGPRPPVPYEVELYDRRQLQRLASLPGMTGWAQVRGRCAITFEEMVAFDLEYIERRSVWFDLRILLLTVPVVLSRKGAD
jgi:lipopolysaccharide/colanic/teichoic acid biosynthesis glycosyltransferase